MALITIKTTSETSEDISNIDEFTTYSDTSDDIIYNDIDISMLKMKDDYIKMDFTHLKPDNLYKKDTLIKLFKDFISELEK